MAISISLAPTFVAGAGANVTIPANPNQVAVMIFYCGHASTAGPTIGGQAMTQVGTLVDFYGTGTGGNWACFRLVNPPTGSQAVAYQASEGGGGIVVFQGASQTPTVDFSSTAHTSTPISGGVTPSVANSMLFGIGDATTGTGLTYTGALDSNGGGNTGAVSTSPVSGAQTYGATFTGGGQGGLIVVAVAPTVTVNSNFLAFM